MAQKGKCSIYELVDELKSGKIDKTQLLEIIKQRNIIVIQAVYKKSTNICCTITYKEDFSNKDYGGNNLKELIRIIEDSDLVFSFFTSFGVELFIGCEYGIKWIQGYDHYGETIESKDVLISYHFSKRYQGLAIVSYEKYENLKQELKVRSIYKDYVNERFGTDDPPSLKFCDNPEVINVFRKFFGDQFPGSTNLTTPYNNLPDIPDQKKDEFRKFAIRKSILNNEMEELQKKIKENEENLSQLTDAIKLANVYLLPKSIRSWLVNQNVKYSVKEGFVSHYRGGGSMFKRSEIRLGSFSYDNNLDHMTDEMNSHIIDWTNTNNTRNTKDVSSSLEGVIEWISEEYCSADDFPKLKPILNSKTLISQSQWDTALGYVKGKKELLILLLYELWFYRR